MKLSLYFLLFILLGTPVYAQKSPGKLGDADPSDIQLKAWPGDTSAVAAVLCNYGYFHSADFRFERFVRIKIFKKEGYDWADHTFSAYSNIYVKGITYNLVNGETVETKLDQKSIITEKFKDGRHRVHFAMPDVKEGSVLDIEVSSNSFPEEWRFQETIPVRWSELNIEPSQVVGFQVLLIGKKPLFVNQEGRWVAKDMPAFHSEPYMNSIENYISKLEVDLNQITTADSYKSYASSWKAVNYHLLGLHSFGGAMSDDGYLRDATAEIKAKTKIKEDQLRMACEKIKRLKWNNDISLYTDWDTQEIMYSKGTGNSAELNMALLQLLKRLGFQAIPVVLSTRENGTLSATQPSINKLNYVVVCVWLNNKTLLLDATEPLLPYTLLPNRCLNHLGRSICDTTSWVYISAEGKDKQSTYYNLTLGEDFNLQGKMNVSRAEYGAFNFRTHYKSFNSPDEYLENYIHDKQGLSITHATVQDLDSVYKPVTQELDIKIDNQQNVIKDEIYLQPLFYNKLDENPFKEPVRNYPLDFAYPTERTVTVVINLPANVTVSFIPEPVSMRLADKSVSFTYQVSALDNMLQISYKYVNNKSMVDPQEYGAIREFFNQLIKKQSEAIILKKK